MAVTLEELQIKFTAQMGNLNSQLSGVKKQLGAVSASAGKAQGAMSGLARAAKLFIGVYLVRGMVKIGKESLSMANDVVESEQLFAVSMKGMAGEAREWSDGLRDSLGLNAYSLRKNVGMFNTMFRSMGLGTQQAYDMATGLIELSEDMASFYNISSEDMFVKLQAGISGEIEPLRKLGIILNETTTKNYALRTGMITQNQTMTESQKVMARYGLLLELTSDAQGDLARTIDSPVNQIRILGNTLDMAKIALGQAFQPIQAIVLPLLNSLAQAALSAANALKTFMWALTGFTGIGANAGAIAGAGADANDDLTDSLEDSAKAYKAAGGAAKKAAKDAKIGLKAFDEINKLTEKNADTGGGGAGLSEVPEIIEPEQPAIVEALSESLSKAADWLKKVWEIAEPTRAALSRLWDAIKEFGETVVWGSIVDFYEKFLKPIGEWTLTKGAPAFLDMLTSAIGAFQTMWEKSRPAWDRFYNDFLVPIGEWAGQAFIDAMGWLKEKFNDLSNWINDNQGTFSIIVDFLTAFGAGIITVWAASSLITTVTNAFGALKIALAFFSGPAGIITLIITGLILLATHWDEVKAFAITAWEKIVEVWGKVSTWIDENVTQPMVKWFKQAWEDIKGFFTNAWATITGLWSTVSTWFNNAVVQPVVAWFKQAWEDIKGFFSGAWAAITGLWSTVSTWFYNSVVKPIIDWFASIGIDLPGIFSGAWSAIVTAWTGASTWFNDTVIAPIVKWFSDKFGYILLLVKSAWDGIVTAWTGAATWFDTNVIGPIRDAWDSAITTITGWWNALLNLLGLGAKSEISIYETTYKSEVVKRTYTDSGGTTTTTEYKGTGGNIDTPPPQNIFQKIGDFFGFARGGVFEANKPILGLLGDQKSGRNIEAPEGVIREIFRDEMYRNALSGVNTSTSYSSLDTANGNIVQSAVEAVLNRLQIIMNVDGQTFGRASIRAINNVQRTAGTVLFEM